MARTKHGVELSNKLDEDGLPTREYDRISYISESEIVVGKFEPISLGAATTNLLERAHAAVKIGDNHESPIEQQIGAAIWMYFDRQKNPLSLCLMVDFDNAPDGLLLVPQYKWSFYRSDWAVIRAGRPGGLLIECDGRAFHSSPEQRAHDRKKDRAAHDRGFLTLRFTGSEIFKDADGCAKKVYDTVCGG